MSRVYFIADLHFGHKNICKFRTQFETVQDHDKFVLDGILSTCGKRDTLYLLGDCFFTEYSLEYLREIKAKIGQVHLILGNHDSENGRRQGYIKTMLSQGLIDNIHGLLSYKGCWISHAPIHDKELRGKFCVHGHTHNVVINDNRYFGVSCEQINYKPINFQEVIKQLESGNDN